MLRKKGRNGGSTWLIRIYARHDVAGYCGAICTTSASARTNERAVCSTGFDPTVSKNKTVACNQCGAGEAVFFMGPSTGKDADMALIFLCTACKHKWLQ